MGSSCPIDSDKSSSGHEGLAERAAEAQAFEPEIQPLPDGLVLIDAEGHMSPLDFKAIAPANRPLQLNQRFARTWDISDNALERIKMETELRRALDRGEFHVYLQPQADVTTNRIVGAEALVRWRHPERGLILPDDFIPFAEESGLIVQLGELVLRTACQQAIRREMAGLPQVRIAVNLSAVQFREPGLASLVKNVLNETSVDPRILELEITESTAMRHATLALEILNDLTALGIKISLDDFGTGYSSLQHLKEFPIYALKIDRSFVSGVTTNTNDAAVVKAIIAIGQSLGLQVIAEGIETAGQLEFLKDQACGWYQGFLLARPQPEEAFHSLLEQCAA